MKFKRSKCTKEDAKSKKLLGLEWCWTEELETVFDDNVRVIAKDQDGNIMFTGSKFLFQECFKKGFFVEL